MAITVNLCENDDYGNPSGKAHCIDFDPIVCRLECTLWPPEARGVTVRRLSRNRIKVGREEYEIFASQSLVGNIYWNSVSMSGVDAVRLMNYLMKLKYWECTEGEEYIYEQFQKREFIDPLIVAGMDKNKAARIRG